MPQNYNIIKCLISQTSNAKSIQSHNENAIGSCGEINFLLCLTLNKNSGGRGGGVPRFKEIGKINVFKAWTSRRLVNRVTIQRSAFGFNFPRLHLSTLTFANRLKSHVSQFASILSYLRYYLNWIFSFEKILKIWEKLKMKNEINYFKKK